MTEQKESLLTNEELNLPPKSQNRFDGLSPTQIWAYGIGHFINDLAATCWFNYLLYFLKEIVRTPAASLAILAGQIADGIATPIVGQLSDKTRTKYGQRKPWYVAGLILVVCTFLPTFQNFRKLTGNTESTTMETVYYVAFPSLFNVGWAALQISHMSLVPSLTCSRKRRDRLNNLRNTFTFVSNFTVLAMALIIFSVMSDPTLEINLISYIVVALGISTSVFFIMKIDEVRLTTVCNEKVAKLKQQLEDQKKTSQGTIGSGSEVTEFSEDDELHIIQSKKKTIKVSRLADWFKLPSFYIFGLCYMGVRLYSNLFGTLMPFYLVYVLKLGRSSEPDPDTDTAPNNIPFVVALIPLLIYLSSVCTSFVLSKFYERFGRKMALMTGGLLCVGCATFLIFLSSTFSWPMYGLAILIGVAQSMVLATGINLISEVIGTKGEQGAFVFGIYSLLDKFSAGLAIFFITSSDSFTNHNSDFIRYMTVLVPSAACVGACLVVLFTPIQQYNQKNKIDKKLNRRKSTLEEELVV